MLVVGDDPQLHTAKKYSFAVANRGNVVFVHYSAIQQLYELWMEGSDITRADHSHYQDIKNQPLRMLHVLRDRYAAKPLASFIIFLGRLNASDPKLAKRLERRCEQMGCVSFNAKQFVVDAAVKNPTRHVLFITDTDSSTRAQAATEYGVPLVHYKWILDCYQRGATLQFDPYYLLENIDKGTPLEDIGKEACGSLVQELDLSAVAPQKYESDGSTVVPPAPVVINDKSKAQAAKLWERALDKTETKEKETEVLSSQQGEDDTQESKKRDASETSSSPDKGIFDGCIFYIHSKFGTRRSQILEKVLVKGGGIVEETDTPPVTHILVPSDAAVDTLQLGPHDTETQVVTDFFVERCLQYKKLISPPDTWCKPLLHTRNFTIQPSKLLMHNRDNKLHIATTGFYGVELMHLKKVLELLRPMGICFSEYLNAQTDLLVLNISSLGSIPKTHALWDNEYGDLLKENSRYIAENPTSINNSAVFRDSMKRKLNFAKVTHPIPVVTPAFVMALLHGTERLQPGGEYDKKVHINIERWCVNCLKGNTSERWCKVKYTDDTMRNVETLSEDAHIKEENEGGVPKLSREQSQRHHNSTKPSRAPSSSYSSAKAMAKDVLNTIQSASTAQMKQPRKRMHRSNSTPRVKQESPQKHSSSLPTLPVMKRPKLSMSKKVEPIGRADSWGAMMASELERTGEDKVDVPALPKPEDAVSANEEVAYTQITYGVTHDPKTHTSAY